MEKLSETFENIKERFSNPLIFSFIVSWLICNWQITLTLAWHDLDEVKLMGFNNTYQFLRFQLCHNHDYKHPILIAIIYTIALPYLRNFIRLINASSELLGNKWTLLINKGASVPFEEYYKLDLKTKERENTLSEMIQSAGKLNHEINTLNLTILDNSEKIKKLTHDLSAKDSILFQLEDKSILDGYWVLRYENNLKEHLPQQLLFRSNKIFHFIEGEKYPKYTIRHFYHNIQSKQLHFIAVEIEDNTKFKIFSFSNANDEYMNGTVNEFNISIKRGKIIDTENNSQQT
jgi:hypothetical protein